MLLGVQFFHRYLVAHLHLGQVALLFRRFVLALFIEHGEARELFLHAAEAELRLAAAQLDRQRVINGGRHLRGEIAIVNQLIESVLVARERGLDLFRRKQRVRGADGLVRILCVFASLIDIGRFGQVLRRKVGRDIVARGGQRLVGQTRGVGADIRNQADRAFTLDVHAFIEHLRDLHGLLRGEGELAHGFLLKVRGRKGRLRILPALTGFD